MKVKLLKGSKTAKEVNESTNPKMGKRHVNFESMLRTFDIEGVANAAGGIMPLTVAFFVIGLTEDGMLAEGNVLDAEILENGKIKVW